jgi:hypothetical protein
MVTVTNLLIATSGNCTPRRILYVPGIASSEAEIVVRIV